MTPRTHVPRWLRRRRLPIAVGSAAVAGVVALTTVAGASGSDGFRTAEVQRDDVDQSLHDTGTVQPVDQAAVSFPVAGTVATVDVAVGQAVATGQPLATLDGTQLQQAINTAQAELDQAELQLAKARSGQLSGPSGGTGGNGSDGRLASVDLDSGSGTGRAVLASAAQDVDDGLADAQDAVLRGQRTVDERLADAQDALDTADRICAAVGQPEATTSTTAPTTSSTVAPTSSSSSSTTSTTVDPSPAIDACRGALGDVLAAQQAVRDAQEDLAQAAAALDQLLAERAPAAQSSGSDQAQDQGGTQPDGSTGSISSADLISYQKAVDAAEAKLAVAQQALKQATIVSPIDGTVAVVDLSVGDAVAAGSATSRIVVVGAGGYEVVATIGVDDLPDVDLGDPATVRPDGRDQDLTGKVVAIGVAATGGTGATTYPVTISVPPGAGLRNGSVAAVAIVTDAASGALVVPTSAVRAEGGRHTVQVLDGGTPKPVAVEVGAIGPIWTEITSGLRAGERVVLADLDEPLPSSATSSSNGQGRNREVRLPGRFDGPITFKAG